MTTETGTTDAKASPNNPRRILVALAGLCFVTLLVSAYALAKRIEHFNSDRDAPAFAFIQVALTDFDFYDHRVEITEATGEAGEPLIRVGYASETLDLPVAVEPRYPLPTLYERHKDWFTVLLFGDRSGQSLESFNDLITRGEIEPRLVIAMREPFGAEAAKEKKFDSIEHEQDWMWGESRRDLWLFRFYELMPDGSIKVHQPLRFPESGASLARRQNYADLRGEEIPSREPGELREYTWQYGAALKLTPRPPAITMENQALRAAGWTLPVSAASFLGMFVFLFFGFAPKRTGT